MNDSAIQPRIQTVYLLEDHELYKLGLEKMISESEDFSFVGHADNVLTAVAECRRINPDVVLVDMQLKGETGVTLIRSLRANGKLPLIAVITNHNDPRLVATCENAGANAFIYKEESLAEVLTKMRRMRPGQWEQPRMHNPIQKKMKVSEELPLAAWASLSPRELDCMRLLSAGLQQDEAARQLNISVNTMKNHRKNIYKKMGFSTKMDLVLFCRENGVM